MDDTPAPAPGKNSKAAEGDAPAAAQSADDSAAADAAQQARLQAHLKAMADAEQSVAATDDVVAQAVQQAGLPPQA